MSRCWGKMRLSRALAICVTAAFLVAPGSGALAQQPNPKTRVPMLCKTSAGGQGLIRGFVFVTLSNLTKSTIPQGQMLFAKKGNVTIQFRAAKPIPESGSVINRTSKGAFQVEGDCEGWY